MTASPETRPVPLVVIGGTIVHRASAVRQITGPRPIRHRTATTPALAAAHDARILDRVIRAAAGAIVVAEIVKTGIPWWLALRLADGLMVAIALAGH